MRDCLLEGSTFGIGRPLQAAIANQLWFISLAQNLSLFTGKLPMVMWTWSQVIAFTSHYARSTLPEEKRMIKFI